MTPRSLLPRSLAAAAVVLTVGLLAAPPAHAEGIAAVPASASVTSSLPDIAIGHDTLAYPALVTLGAYRTYMHTPSVRNFEGYVHRRDMMASAVGRRLGLSGDAMRDAWNQADTIHQIALLSALTQLGVPYHLYHRIPGQGFDCSGLTSWAWDQVGVNMSHVANWQIQNIKNISKSSAQAGDIVYFPGHAMMYLGVSTAIIHAPYTGRTVEMDVLQYHESMTRYGDPLPLGA